MGWGKMGKGKSGMNIRKSLRQESSHDLKHLQAGQTSSHHRVGNPPFQGADFHDHHLHFGLQRTQPCGKTTPCQRSAAWVRASNLSRSLPGDFGTSAPVSGALPAFAQACRRPNIQAAFASWHSAAMQWHERSVQKTISADLQSSIKPSKGVK